MRHRAILAGAVALAVFAAAAGADERLKIKDLGVKGEIEGENITFTVDFTIEARVRRPEIALVSGDLVVAGAPAPRSGRRLRYVPASRTYFMSWRRGGTHTEQVSFACRPAVVEGGEWREATFTIPASDCRKLELKCDRTDLEVRFPGAMKLERKKEGDELTVTALLGPGRPFAVRWKPKVEKLEAKLVMSAEGNAIVRAGTGALRLDTLFLFRISQGSLKELAFSVPKALSVTQVRGALIQDWDIDEAGDSQRLLVTLTRPETSRYAIEVASEMVLREFPVEIGLPAVEPEGVIRSSGFLAVGTDSALKLVVTEPRGLSQIDASAFPRVVLDTKHPRALPRSNTFFYNYATSPYQMKLSIDDIVPSYDASERLVVSVTEDDLVIDAGFDLDVRDAPVRSLIVETDPGFIIAKVEGTQVADYSVKEPEAGGARQQVEVQFKGPVIGRTLIKMRMELGEGPLGTRRKIGAISVKGAKTERGYIAVAAEQGVEIDSPEVTGLGEVHTGSVPMRVPGAKIAYRFREGKWSLGFLARKKPASIRAEAFHLISIGEGQAYGSVAMTYHISGAPLDELAFKVPEELRNVEFVGGDVRHWSREGTAWKVELQRKVIGEYTLLVTHNQHYADSNAILVGGVEPVGVHTQTGYICVASHLNLELSHEDVKRHGLIAIEREEVPVAYRLPVSAPILKSFKYNSAPHGLRIALAPYDPGELVPAVVDMAEIVTKISINNRKEAQSSTAIWYKVKNSREQFLALSMPLEARVWSVHELERGPDGRGRLRRIPASLEKELLFGVGLGLQSDLEGGSLSDAFLQEFLAHGITPSAGITITPEEEGSRWRITDVGAVRTYTAERTDKALNIYDREKELLMVPLERKRNPNEPATIRVVYGRSHGKPGLRGKLALVAPKSTIRSTFARWTVQAPYETLEVQEEGQEKPGVRYRPKWAIYPAGGTMPADERGVEKRAGLAGLLADVGSGWKRGIEKLSSVLAIVVSCLAAAGLVALLVLRRKAFPVSALAVVLLGGLALGIAARHAAPGIGRGPDIELSRVSFTQALKLGDELPAVAVRVVPLWRRQATFVGAVVTPLAAVACLVAAALVRKRRSLLLALGISGIVYAAAQFPALWPAMAHVFTWGLPAILIVAFLIVFFRATVSRLARAAPTAAALVAATLLFPARAEAADGKAADNFEIKAVNRVEYALKANKDHMEVAVLLVLDADRVLSIPVMPGSAALLTQVDRRKPFSVEQENGAYRVKVRKRGRHEIDLGFLTPLGPAGKNGLRAFRLSMPRALTNAVTLEIPEGGLDVESPTAVRLTKDEKESSTLARAAFGPSDECIFIWKPRERKTKLEKAAFFAEVTSLVRFDAGLAECRSRMRLQIAQGELKVIQVKIPAGMTVTSVKGADLGTWRFDPSEGALEVRLDRAASGQYELLVITQTSGDGLPYVAQIGTPRVAGAERQRGSVGLATSAAVYIETKEHPAPMNVDDFVRDAAELVSSAGARPSDVRSAYRYHRLDETVVAEVNEVRAEIRARERATFDVQDDRLIYNGELVAEIAKAGVFSATLVIPEGYDIDDLSAPELSHWDDTSAEGGRHVRVHFKKRLLGAVALKLRMSQAVAELASRIDLPRVVVQGALKHTGIMVVKSERGVRLSIAERKGVSELDPTTELNIREERVLAFRLLRPEWSVALRTEIVGTRSEVDFLHIARVSEGRVRHTDHLNYVLFNAGSKTFEVRVPEGALSVEVIGPYIADTKEPEPGLWRIELARKWYDPEHRKPWRLTVRYETRFDSAAKKLEIVPAKAVGVGLQRGHVAVYATEKVELKALTVGSELQLADARSVGREFGAGDLSGAAFCYSSPTADYDLALEATRHEAARLLQARVRWIRIRTIVTERGECITRVRMRLLVGAKRYLETGLPERSEIWSLLVDGRSQVPSTRAGASGEKVLLVPLGQASSDEIPVSVEFVYVSRVSKGWERVRRELHGPRFDLPLNDMEWVLFLPKSCDYADFEGSLWIDQSTLRKPVILSYKRGAYEKELQAVADYDNQEAERLIAHAGDLARRGQQKMAKQALENAVSLSLSRADLNEDARGQLHKLVRRQAVVGLVGRRNKLRPKVGAAKPEGGLQGELGENFKAPEAERLESSLGKDDSRNLELIADTMIGQQEAAAGFNWPLKIHLAERGRAIRLSGSVQVEPNAEMSVSFDARRRKPARPLASPACAAALAALIFAAIYAVRSAAARLAPAQE